MIMIKLTRRNIVKDALKHKKLKIVTFEWLEDSIGEGKTRKRVEKYLLASTERKAKKEESRKEKDSQKGASKSPHPLIKSSDNLKIIPFPPQSNSST